MRKTLPRVLRESGAKVGHSLALGGDAGHRFGVDHALEGFVGQAT
jgi:hypothetical protein